MGLKRVSHSGQKLKWKNTHGVFSTSIQVMVTYSTALEHGKYIDPYKYDVVHERIDIVSINKVLILAYKECWFFRVKCQVSFFFWPFVTLNY